MFPATVSCGQPWICCQTAYGIVSATAAATPPAPHHDTSGRRGPTTSSTSAKTVATNRTCGLASPPIPATTPAASTDAPLPRTTALTSSQPRAVVESRSNVVVVTKWPTASATPDAAVQAAAIT